MCKIYEYGVKTLVSVGDVFQSKEGCKAVVTKYEGCGKVTVRFLDEYSAEICLQSGRLKQGGFKNPFYPSVFSTGFRGVGEHKANDNKYSRHVYNKWKGMIERVHSDKYLAKRPSYVDCSIDKSWYNFQNFAEWFKNQDFSNEDYQLDKDILFKNNKVYSEKTCCLVPKDVNTLILNRTRDRGKYPVGVYKNNHTNRFVAQSCNTGERYLGTFDTPEEAFYAYKAAKENYIKEVANKYKDQIDIRAYEALMKYEVNIDD